MAGDSSKAGDEETAGLNADNFVLDLYRRRSFNETFWGGVRVACIALSLMMSSYSLYKTTGIRSSASAASLGLADFQKSEKAADLEMLIKIKSLNASLISKSAEVNSGVPVAFDCHLTDRQTRAVVVTYDGCFVDTTGGDMNMNTGVFTVSKPGIYQLTFTAKYVSSSKGRFGAWSDIYVNDKVIADSQREYNGNELSTTESSTHSIVVFYPLSAGDLVRVQFNKDGDSYIHSDGDHDVHFTGLRLGDLPPQK